MSDEHAAFVGSEVPKLELRAPVGRHCLQSTMNSFAPVAVEERWGSASSATW
jgi:hypothetical protein